MRAVTESREKRFEMLCAMTEKLAAAGWRGMDDVPKDETEVEIRVVNMIAADCEDPEQEGYISVERGHWIDFNGGGMTWHGMCGRPSMWRPIQN